MDGKDIREVLLYLEAGGGARARGIPPYFALSLGAGQRRARFSGASTAAVASRFTSISIPVTASYH